MQPAVGLLSVATAVPEFSVGQDEVKKFAEQMFQSSGIDLAQALAVFDNSEITTRHFAQPVEWYRKPHTFVDKNQVYLTQAAKISSAAAQKALELANTDPTQIKAIVFVSSTGISTPSLDVTIIERLGLPSSISRLPLWGLGCGGGVSGLARACDLVRATDGHVLLVAVELCSITFVPEDLRKANLIACSLFGDGAAAVVLGPQPGKIQMCSSHSELVNDSQQLMGWDVVPQGLQVRFGKEIPDVALKFLPNFMNKAAKTAGYRCEDLTQFLVHPGGKKILEAYRQMLSSDQDGLRLSAEILRDFGNMSSPTVLFVLEKFLAHHRDRSNGPGMLIGLGPGFCAEGVTFVT